MASKDVKPYQNRSKSNRAGLTFPVSRIHRLLRKGNYAERIGTGNLVNNINLTIKRLINHFV